MVGYLARRLGSRDLAADAAQEAFVRLWEKRERWTDGSARALLFRLGMNAGEDLRRRAGARARAIDRLGAEPGTAGTTPDELAEASETWARVEAAVEGLAPKRREIFELVRWEGLGYREVAELLELSPQTVANHLTLALRDLRDALRGGEPPAEGRADAQPGEEVFDG